MWVGLLNVFMLLGQMKESLLSSDKWMSAQTLKTKIAKEISPSPYGEIWMENCFNLLQFFLTFMSKFDLTKWCWRVLTLDLTQEAIYLAKQLSDIRTSSNCFAYLLQTQEMGFQHQPFV